MKKQFENTPVRTHDVTVTIFIDKKPSLGANSLSPYRDTLPIIYYFIEYD